MNLIALLFLGYDFLIIGIKWDLKPYRIIVYSYNDIFSLYKKIEFQSAAQIQGFINIRMV